MSAFIAGNGPDAGSRRSDFDLGDRNGTTCGRERVDVVAEALTGFGYRVTVNAHYVGAEAARKHGDPQSGVHSLQIEMNRDLYMNEATRERSSRFPQIQQHMATLSERLADFARAGA